MDAHHRAEMFRKSERDDVPAQPGQDWPAVQVADMTVVKQHRRDGRMEGGNNGPKGDHRVRVAAERRERMQRKILAALLAAYGRRPADGLPSVDQIVATADISRATFYKYYSSGEQAMLVLGEQLANEMIEGYQSLFDGSESGFVRMTTAILLFLLRAEIDPAWAAFVSRAVFLHQGSREPFVGIATHLQAARDRGEIEAADLNAAASIGLGAVTEAMGRMARADAGGRRYIEEMSAMILRALGVDMDAGREIVRLRIAHIRQLAPERLAWWADPWS